jgi:hypothetical protein
MRRVIIVSLRYCDICVVGAMRHDVTTRVGVGVGVGVSVGAGVGVGWRWCRLALVSVGVVLVQRMLEWILRG